jgi:hypothetical protein
MVRANGAPLCSTEEERATTPECRRGVEHSTDMEMDLDSRNAALVVGEELHDSVDIPGYEARSTWGCDPNTRSYWASLSPNNGDRDAPPTVSVGWSGPALPRPIVSSSNCAPSSDTIP